MSEPRSNDSELLEVSLYTLIAQGFKKYNFKLSQYPTATKYNNLSYVVIFKEVEDDSDDDNETETGDFDEVSIKETIFVIL